MMTKTFNKKTIPVLIGEIMKPEGDIKMQKEARFTLIKWIISFVLSSTIFLIPTSELFSSQLRLFFVVTILYICILAFELMPSMVPSMLLTGVYVLLGLADFSTALSAWTNTTIYMVIGAFALVNAMQACGLLDRITFWFIAKIGGTFNRACYAIYLLGAILSLITFTNHWLLVVVLAYSVAQAFGYKTVSKESGLIMFAGALGATTTTYWQYAPGFVGLYQTGMQSVFPGLEVGWLQVLVACWPLVVMPLIVMWLLTKMTNSKNFSIGDGKAEFERRFQSLGKVSKSEKISAVLVVVLLAYLLLQPLHKMNLALGFMILPWILYIPQLKVGDLKALQSINYPLIFFMVACMSIGTVGASLGLNTLAQTILTDALSGTPTFAVHFVILILTALGNIVLTPYAMAGAFSAPISSIALTMGLDPITLMYTFSIGSDIFIFPHEIACLVALFSFGLISMKDFIKYATIKTIVQIVFFAIILYPYWGILGIL